MIQRIEIKPRYITERNGERPFQRKLYEAISKREEKIIIVEAPVGSGKTFAIRQLLQNRAYKRSPLVLTYPTKILMESQVASLQREIGRNRIKIWPWENFKEGKLNLFIYSTDALVDFIKNKKTENLPNRGDLIYKLFCDIEWFSKYGAIITSPDVLFLLVKGRYKKSRYILSFLKNSLFVFDEFHCYYGLETFVYLIKELLEKLANKIILLSATPIKRKEFEKLEEKHGIFYISFEESMGADKNICFNFPLKMQIDPFKLSDINETERKLKDLLPKMPYPCAVIFDSIFRLRHIERSLKNKISGINFKEWSGMIKNKDLILDDKTVAFGTSSIEVGIDMKFKSLIFEASYWPSAIQRLGRVGRKEKGQAVMFTRKDFYPYLKDKNEFNRSEFERILNEALNDPKEEIGDEYSFRGQSFNFLLFDEDLKKIFIYNENLFSMYEIDDDYIDNWKCLNPEEKKKKLKEFQLPDSKIDDIIIRDRIIPLWALLKGRLLANYDYLYKTEIIPPTKNRDELHIKGFVFYGDDE